MARYILDGLQMPDGDEYIVLSKGKTFYGLCTTSAATADKTLVIQDFTSEHLVSGTKITVRFSFGNRATASTTLQINGLARKNLYWQGYSAGLLLPESTTVDIIYSGTSWNVVGVRQPDWYGCCYTQPGTQAKVVNDMAGFSDTMLLEGTRVTVRFEFGQTYDGVPTLNIQSTGAKNIQVSAGVNAGYGEWRAGEIVSFVYYNNAWVIENGNHSTDLMWGRTKLSNTIEDNENVALTPKAVYDAGYLTLADLPVWDGSVT